MGQRENGRKQRKMNNLIDTIKIGHDDGGNFKGTHVKSSANPRGNIEWAWTWMGFHAPSYCYIKEADARIKTERYKKFLNCFSTYYGIGDFDYWERKELKNLSDEDRMELLKLLIEDNADLLKNRKYLGLVDGQINPEINEFADSIDFLEKLTPFECSHREWPHNHRCRYSNGFYCEDCKTFYDENSHDYICSEMLSSCWMGIHNCTVDYVCAEKEDETPLELVRLKEDCEKLQELGMFKVNPAEVIAIRDKIRVIVKKYPIHEEMRKSLEARGL